MVEIEECPVNGLFVLKDFINEEEEAELLTHIYDKLWDETLTRRTQQYGWEYNYHGGPLKKARPLPKWTNGIITRLTEENYIKTPPEQLIINEYIPGQGISFHKDKYIFGDTILSVSLGSACMFQFKRHENIYDIYLEPKTLIIMREDARYKWMHGIPGRLRDIVDGTKIQRETRVSLTFRWLAKK